MKNVGDVFVILLKGMVVFVTPQIPHVMSYYVILTYI